MRIVESNWQKNKSNRVTQLNKKQCRATPMKPNGTQRQTKSNSKIENKNQHTISFTRRRYDFGQNPLSEYNIASPQ